MRLFLLVALVSFVYASEVDEACEGRCCTLQISRPVGDDDKYSGTFKLKKGVYVMNGNADVTMEIVENEFYDYGEEDYVTLENWGIIDVSIRNPWAQTVVEGGLEGEDPVGDWPNGGVVECLKRKK